MTRLPHESEPIRLRIHGMHCAGCVAAVDAALRRVPGVAAATVNLATGTAQVQPAGHSPPPAAATLIEAVRSAGYAAELASAAARETAETGRRERRPRGGGRRLGAAVALGLPVIAVHLAESAPPGVVPDAVAAALVPFAGWGVQAGLTVGVMIAAAGGMLLGAARALVRRSANMDLLVSLGALTALASSLLGAWTHAHELVLFHAAVMIVLFVALGKHLEARARGRASAALEALAARLPSTAVRIVGAASETIPVAEVRPGDRLRVPAHTTVPVDGTVASGQAAIDESMLTGESLPAARGPGQDVFGGTLVVDGVIEIVAARTGSDSAAARIARLVEQAQLSKPPWQHFADRAAGAFVPVVLGLALATLIGWKWLAGADTSWALQRAIAVLVVACPCALGLAIPTAVLVGTTRAAERGILVRDAAALEAAGRVQVLLLDKTGTLTVGRPELTGIRALGTSTADDALRAAAAVEQLSPHPLARAIVAAAAARGIAPPAAGLLQSQPGAGVRGRANGAEIAVGTADWLRACGVETAGAAADADEIAARGHSVVWVAIDGRPAALLALADALHPEAAAAVAALHRAGVRVRILSGDREPAVRRVAQTLRIAEFEAGLTPQDKLQRVRALAARRLRAAMVGDGVNDAPALAAADVGIAIGTGADVAREAADICLVGHSPARIAEAIRLSRRSGRIMLQNLFWAVIYNLVMLPVAMVTALPPAAATAAMMASSLTVVGNALRLRRAA